MERRGEQRLKRRHGSAAALQAASGQRLARAHAGLLHTGLSRVALHSHRLQRQRGRQRGLTSQAWRRPSCISRAGASISQARNPLTLNLVLPSLPSTTIYPQIHINARRPLPGSLFRPPHDLPSSPFLALLLPSSRSSPPPPTSVPASSTSLTSSRTCYQTFLSAVTRRPRHNLRSASSLQSLSSPGPLT